MAVAFQNVQRWEDSDRVQHRLSGARVSNVAPVLYEQGFQFVHLTALCHRQQLIHNALSTTALHTTKRHTKHHTGYYMCYMPPAYCAHRAYSTHSAYEVIAVTSKNSLDTKSARVTALYRRRFHSVVSC